jgi:hypothetical protein
MLKFIAGWIVLFSLSLTVLSQESVQVQVYYGGYGTECSWEIINKLDGSVVLAGGPSVSNTYSYNGNISIYPGEYEFKAYDSAGDGWTFPNGNYQITPTQGIATGMVLFPGGYAQSTDFIVLSSNAADVGAVEWLTPLSSAGLTATETVTVRIRNYGTASVTGVNMLYSINGGTSYTTEVYAGTISSGATLDYTFLQTANFSSTGTYNCEFGANVAGDLTNVNDTADLDIISIPSVSSFPYAENFSTWPPQDWTFQGGNSWASYQFSSAYCNFFYWPSGNAEMITPPINLYSPGNLTFDWSSGFDPSYLNDALHVSISSDNGQTWNQVWSKTGVQLNSNDGATSTAPGTFVNASIDLSSYAGSIIYIKFDGVTAYGPNVFVDNVVVDLNGVYDLAVVDFIAPSETGCNLTSTELVTIKVKNFGALPISNFNVSYSIDGGTSYITELIAGPLASGASMNHTFATTADFSSSGTYNCIGNVAFGSDLNPLNDTFYHLVKNLDVISTFPFLEDFETGATNYFDFDIGDYASLAVFNEGSNYALKFEGDQTGAGWVGTATGTTANQAWQINTTQQSTAYTCLVDAGSLSSLELLLDLKQFYKFGSSYSWFRVLINGSQILDVNGNGDFNPTTSYNDPYATIKYDLTSYAGTQFELSLQAANRYSSVSHPPGNVAFVDNVILREIPPPDVAVNSLISPVSACGLTATEVVTVEIQNLGGGDVSNFNISYSVNSGTAVVETVTDVITTGSSYQYSFTATADLSAITSYTIDVNVALTGDQNALNDNGQFIVDHLVPVSLTINGLNATYCYYDASVVLSGSPSGGTFSGNGITGNTFDPLQAGTGSHNITYTYDDLSTGCQSVLTQSVTVNGSAVSFSGLYNGPTTIPVLVEVFYNSFWVSQQSWEIVDEQGTVYLSSPSGTTQNGYSYNGYINLPLGNYTFIASDTYGDGWLASWYKITPDFGTGTGQQNYYIPTAQQPVYSQSTTFSVGGLAGYCLNDAPVTLTGSPVGGTFNGPGISGNTFDPVLAGAGTHTITYAYTDGNNCYGIQSQQVIVQGALSLNLGPDQTACDGETITLDAGVADTYLWSDQSTNQTLLVSQTGVYTVTVTNLAGCESVDEVDITFNPLPSVDLGQDQDVCVGVSVILDAGTADSYIWSNNATSQTIVVTTSDTYTVTITTNGCTSTDEITVTFHDVNLDLGVDQSFCTGSNLLLDAGGGYTSYLWSDNSTASTLLVSTPGTYSCTVTDQYGCEDNDEIVITENPLPVVDLGSDTTIGNEVLVLNAGLGFSSYEWSDGTFGAVAVVDGGLLAEATYTYWVKVTDSYGCEGSDTILVTVEILEQTQMIILPFGWSIFSTYIDPSDTLISDVIAPIVSNVSIVKDGAGAVYWPAFLYNGIGNITIGEGYQILTTAGDTLAIFGLKVVPELIPIPIPFGWSIIGYLRDAPGSAVTVMSSIVSNITIMKAGDGTVYWPGVFYNGIGDMLPGQGYQILTTASVVYTYPSNGPLAAASKALVPQNKFFNNVKNTGSNMTLAIPLDAWEELPQLGDEIGIFNNEGILCGSTVFNNDLTVVTIWGFDEMSNSNGLQLNEVYNIKLYRLEDGNIGDIEISDYQYGDGLFEKDDIELAGKLTFSKSSGLGISVFNYPNPFREETTIKVYLPKDDFILIEVYDLAGKRILEEGKIDCEAGWHHFKLNAANLVSGSYMYTLRTNDSTITKRMTLVQ